MARELLKHKSHEVISNLSFSFAVRYSHQYYDAVLLKSPSLLVKKFLGCDRAYFSFMELQFVFCRVFVQQEGEVYSLMCFM